VCDSLAERVVDDWLHAKGIEHEKSPAYPDAVCANLGMRARADWRVGDSYIEYFGLMFRDDYARRAERKISECMRCGIPLVPLYPGDEFGLQVWVPEIVSAFFRKFCPV
jgi:hypothetical protein